jgi:L-2-hydroxyglutarate oxidase
LSAYIPDIRTADLLPGGCGIRAQAVGRDGHLLDDFLIVDSHAGIFVMNAPSPAATASFAIGRHVADKVLERLQV